MRGSLADWIGTQHGSYWNGAKIQQAGPSKALAAEVLKLTRNVTTINLYMMNPSGDFAGNRRKHSLSHNF